MAQKFFSQGLNSNISQYYDKQLSQANAWESDRMIKTYKTQKIVVKMTRVGKKKKKQPRFDCQLEGYESKANAVRIGVRYYGNM